MIKVQVVSFECTTVSEAAELAARFGLMQPQTQAPTQSLDLTQETETSPYAPAVGMVKEKKAKEKKSKKAMVNLGPEVGQPKLTSKGNVRGDYRPLRALEPGNSVTLQQADLKGLRSAIWNAKRKNPEMAFSYKETTNGKLRVTRDK